MQMSELRYSRNRRRLDLAARLIEFEARTGTIRELTGLTDTRIRSLSKECGADGKSGGRTRHRGSSPHRVAKLLGKARTKNEAATLIGLCQLMGLQPAHGDPRPGTNRVVRAERLCDAYWTFRYLLPQTTISFEHMLLLLSEAAKGEEMAVTHCSSCSAILVADALSLYSTLCAHCEQKPFAGIGTSVARYRCVAEEPAVYK